MESPLTKSQCIKIDQIDSTWIISCYKNMGIDVVGYFQNIPKVEIWKDTQSGYKFYHPFNIEGDASFYEKLGVNDWYYMPWKWEYDAAMKFIGSQDKVLEVGCGNADFLEKLKQLEICKEVTGIEFNPVAIKNANEKGINVISAFIEEYGANNQGQFDIVCSFQVLEHIGNVQSFLDGKLSTLKKGGKMIIGVPNNDSFIRFQDPGLILNYPPHHQGLWDKNSLKGLEKIFNIKLLATKFEPLQSYNFELFRRVFRNQMISNKYVRYLFNRFGGDWLLKKTLPYLANYIQGHTILAVFEKK